MIRKINHEIVYWCDMPLVIEITSFPESKTPPTAVIVYGGSEETTEEECQAYIAGVASWMHSGFCYEES